MINKEGKSIFLLISFVLVLLFASIVIADHVVTPTSLNIVEDESKQFNFTVNYTIAEHNISRVNFTFPSSFDIDRNTNGTAVVYSEFMFDSTNNVATWVNDTDGLVQNYSKNSFWINGTPISNGAYSIIIETYNGTNVSYSTIAVTVNFSAEYNYWDDISGLYNITVNNSLIRYDNVTLVNVTLPTGFTYTLNTNGSSLAGANFSNISSQLRWVNFTGDQLFNESVIHYFWFNASAVDPGYYNMTYEITNGTSTIYTNTTIFIKDAINFTFKGVTIADYGNYSNASSIAVNLSIGQNDSVSSFSLNLLNTSNSTAMQTNYQSGNLDLFVNYSSAITVDGVYKINATANNSDYGRYDSMSDTLTVTYDSREPYISMSSDSATNKTYIAVDVTITDLTGASTCSVNSGGSFIGGASTCIDGSCTFEENDQDCGTSYSYNVSCTDFAGNINSTVDSFSTDSCPSSSSSSSSGGSSSSSSSSGGSTRVVSSWLSTFDASDEKLEDRADDFSYVLAEKQRVKIDVANEHHHVGVIEIDLEKEEATINVSSPSYEDEFEKGDVKKYDVTEDGYYDIQVTLLGVDTFPATKADIGMVAIHELAPVVESDGGNESVNGTSEGASELIASTGFNFSRTAAFVIGGIVVLILVLLLVGFFIWRHFDNKKKISGKKGMKKGKYKSLPKGRGGGARVSYVAYLISTIGYGIAVVAGFVAVGFFLWRKDWLFVVLGVIFLYIAWDNFFSAGRARNAGFNVEGFYIWPFFTKGKYHEINRGYGHFNHRFIPKNSKDKLKKERAAPKKQEKKVEKKENKKKSSDSSGYEISYG